MVSLPRNVIALWDKWNIRGFIMLSLSLQVSLILLAPLRERTSNSWIIFLIWSAYLLADFVAIFVLGLISNNQDNRDNYKNDPTCDLWLYGLPSVCSIWEVQIQ